MGLSLRRGTFQELDLRDVRQPGLASRDDWQCVRPRPFGAGIKDAALLDWLLGCGGTKSFLRRPFDRYQWQSRW
jgi:hypothetical protein